MEHRPSYQRTTLFGFTDIAPFARNAMECLVGDSFTQCFEVRLSLAIDDDDDIHA